MKNHYLNYYQLLDVDPSASNDEILKAYKEKAKKYHPDVNNGHHTANTLFQYIQQAKEVLTDPQKRNEYDLIAGIKKRYEPKPRVIKVPVKEKSNNVDALLAAGAIGLLVGIFLGSSSKK